MEATRDALGAGYGEPLIRVVMMPRDTNTQGNIFGGTILSYIDFAAGEEAVRIARGRVVTKLVREVEFIAPVFVGDHVAFHTKTVRLGRTSVTVRVLVIATRGRRREISVKVTEAELVMVAIDDDGQPRPIERDGP